MTIDPNRTFPARNDGYQGVSCVRFAVNFGDAGIGSGFQFATIPQNSFILDVDVDVEIAFNAGTTNVLTVGTTTTATEIVNAADVSESGIADTNVLRGRGRSLTSGGDTAIYGKFAQTGTAATAGKAHVCVTYAPPNG